MKAWIRFSSASACAGSAGALAAPVAGSGPAWLVVLRYGYCMGHLDG